MNDAEEVVWTGGEHMIEGSDGTKVASAERLQALRYFLDHEHDEVEPLADAIFADYRKWREVGWSAADAYCAIVNWLGEQLEPQ